jgi:ABC-type sugar transport system substrate-binding protein
VAANPKLKVVAEAPADWNRQKAMEVTSQILTAHPNVQAIFVNNEDMTVGASMQSNAPERLPSSRSCR